MRFLTYVLGHLRSRTARTGSTVIALALCIFLFCTLQAFLGALRYNLRTSTSTRLITRNKVSLMFPLPLSYRAQIAGLQGVKRVSAMHFFGGSRKTETSSDFFANYAVEPEPFLAMFPEIVLSEEQRSAFLADPRSCIVGRKIAEHFGWKVGSTFHLESFIPPFQLGAPWDFVVSGIFDADEVHHSGTDTTAMYFHFSRLYEATRGSHGVGNYVVELDSPDKTGQVSQAIERLFENSAAQTFTQTEAAFRAGLVAAAGDLAPLLNMVALAVMFAVLLVIANTMGMSVRERRKEIGVLKTLGFSDAGVMSLIAVESLIIGVLGGGIGVLFSAAAVRGITSIPFLGDAVRAYPDLALSPVQILTGLLVAVLLGGMAGVLPSILAYRVRVVDALRSI